MDETQSCVAAEITRWSRIRWKLNSKTWPYTSKVAYQIYRLTRWALEPWPKHYPTFVLRFLAGLAEGCWTHVCGHGPKFSFHMAMIYWWPKRTAKQARDAMKTLEQAAVEDKARIEILRRTK